MKFNSKEKSISRMMDRILKEVKSAPLKEWLADNTDQLLVMLSGYWELLLSGRRLYERDIRFSSEYRQLFNNYLGVKVGDTRLDDWNPLVGHLSSLIANVMDDEYARFKYFSYPIRCTPDELDLLKVWLTGRAFTELRQQPKIRGIVETGEVSLIVGKVYDAFQVSTTPLNPDPQRPDPRINLDTFGMELLEGAFEFAWLMQGRKALLNYLTPVYSATSMKT